MAVYDPNKGIACMSRIPLLFLLIAVGAQAGWKPKVSHDESGSLPDRVSIFYASGPNFGLPTLKDALTELADSGHIDNLGGIILYGGRVDPSFQREVIEMLQKHAPQELAIALEAGGGTYENPVLEPLHTVFDEFVLQTATVKAINEQLAAIGKRVSRASHEKLAFRRTEEPIEIHFFLYLGVEDN